MNYKTYAEAKIANPDSEIVVTGKRWSGCDDDVGYFEKRMKEHQIGDDAWAICNPAYYCSTLKEFLEASLKLVYGDKIQTSKKSIFTITDNNSGFNNKDGSSSEVFILSASALNGGCKMPAKAEKWTIYNNAMPLRELTDEQYGKMRRMHDSGAAVEFANVTNGFEFEVIDNPKWCKDQVYRIKSKSEREMFIDKSMEAFKENQHNKAEFMLGKIYDAGARYKDLTQHFGENI